MPTYTITQLIGQSMEGVYSVISNISVNISPRQSPHSKIQLYRVKNKIQSAYIIHNGLLNSFPGFFGYGAILAQG